MEFSSRRLRPKMFMAMKRGWARRCPSCGDGSLYKGARFKEFISIVDRCAACGERLGHIRADDIPAYFTVLIVGHIMLSALLLVEVFKFPVWTEMAVAVPLTLGLVFHLLPSVKGAIAARLWALGMPTGIASD